MLKRRQRCAGEPFGGWRSELEVNIVEARLAWGAGDSRTGGLALKRGKFRGRDEVERVITTVSTSHSIRPVPATARLQCNKVAALYTKSCLNQARRLSNRNVIQPPNQLSRRVIKTKLDQLTPAGPASHPPGQLDSYYRTSLPCLRPCGRPLRGL